MRTVTVVIGIILTAAVWRLAYDLEFARLHVQLPGDLSVAPVAWLHVVLLWTAVGVGAWTVADPAPDRLKTAMNEWNGGAMCVILQALAGGTLLMIALAQFYTTASGRGDFLALWVLVEAVGFLFGRQAVPVLI